MSRATGFPDVHRLIHVLIAVLAFSTPVLAQPGTVTVSAPTLFDIGGTHVSIATGDLDGDGALDIAAADPGGRAITVLLGDGNGGFRELLSYPLTDKPTAVALADVDGDDVLDVVVAFSETGSVAVLRGEGGGSFAAPAFVQVGGSPHALAAGHFNDDGSADVAVLDRSGARIAVLLGDGTGS
ncbi:MAG TPA: VCBS repeat-containing protein, partial [Gemmatimonadaceae bacterium]|nr:VCBS repeat-containing protein [Gemmatimonadaceae bacterium]